MGKIYHHPTNDDYICLFGYVGNNPCIFTISIKGRYRLDLPGYVVCFDEFNLLHEYFRWVGYRPEWESLRKKNYQEYYRKERDKLFK